MSDKKNKAPDFEAIAKKVIEQLPNEVGAMAKTFFESSFDNEGFTDNAFISWPKRKDNDVHKILTRSGALKGSIAVTLATKERVEVEAGRGVPYAAIHNTGGLITIKVTKKSRRFFWYMFSKTKDTKWKFMALTKKTVIVIKIPQRQYIGNSQQLLKNIDQHVIQKIISNFSKLN